MKTVLMILGLVLGIQAQAQCPDFSGTFHLEAQKLQSTPIPYAIVDGVAKYGDESQVSNMYTNFRVLQGGGTMKMEIRSNGTESLSWGPREHFVMILDGARRDFSRSMESDGYFQDYQARCSGRQILITESGTNNSTEIKRVDQYNSYTTIELLDEGTWFFGKKKKFRRTMTSYVANSLGQTVLRVDENEIYVQD